MSKKIGFVGLGIMGKPMAINIKNAGYELSVFDRHKENIEDLTKIGAIGRSSPADTARNSDITITMVQDSPQSLEVITGENGIIEGASENDLVIDMSSIEPEISKSIAKKILTKKINIIDAPVSRGEP